MWTAIGYGKLTFGKLDILRVDIVRVDILRVDILRVDILGGTHWVRLKHNIAIAQTDLS